MPRILAVYIQDSRLSAARFLFSRDEEPILEGRLVTSRPEREPLENGEFGEFAIGEEWRSFLAEGQDESVVLFEPRVLVSERMSVPFREERKIEQVIPLQIEEELPFDVEGVLLDQVLVGEPNENGESPLLVLGVAEEEIAATLSLCRALGLDPAILAPGVVALGELLRTEGQSAGFALTEGHFLFSYCEQGSPKLYRESRVDDENSALDEIVPSLLAVVRAVGSPPAKVLVCGRKLQLPFEGMSCEPIERPGIGKSAEELLLFGIAQARAEKRRTLNFRKKQFRYKGNYRQYFLPLLEQGKAFGLLTACVVLWCVGIFYAEASRRNLVDERFESAVRGVFPTEVVPAGSEVSFVNGKVAELEGRLKGLGSISSLSPLEAFRELSETIGPNIDIAIDTISLSPSGVTFGGSVADSGTVGRLFGLLEKKPDRFCSVKVDPRGAAPGSNRVRVVAELKYCP